MKLICCYIKANVEICFLLWQNVNQQEPHTNETTSNTCFGFVMTMVYVNYVPVSSSLLYRCTTALF